MQSLDEITNKVNIILYPFKAYCVGGAVRDTLLGVTPKDYDFSTDAPVDDIEEAVRKAGRRPYITGKRFGTIGFKIQMSDMSWQYIEVTTFRKEKYLPGSRKPEVEFIDDVIEDLSRRDLTIGAIAYRDGEYIDPFGGRIDLLEKKIKVVGKAKDRYTEDPLRMLRVARFSAQLGFDVDPNLIGQIRQMSSRILTVSKERWMQELSKLLVQNKVGSGINTLMDTYLLRYVLPESWLALSNWRDEIIQYTESSSPTVDARWAAFLSPIGRPYVNHTEAKDGRILYTSQHLITLELIVGIALRLKWSNAMRNSVLASITPEMDKSIVTLNNPL